jgi:hypothetical protein|eukprot:COSAG01_NODE_10730_length_2093_cov_1.668506_2_plen_48_part_00
MAREDKCTLQQRRRSREHTPGGASAMAVACWNIRCETPRASELRAVA